tara:strand:+ start:2542 stop:3054 length:513 start_codon:yes stop_codon:yes gene_type:complete
VLDSGFFSILVRELPMQYRKYIFAPTSGQGARNVFGKKYPPYSTFPSKWASMSMKVEARGLIPKEGISYADAKKTGQMKRQAESYARSRSPVLSGALMNDVMAGKGLLSNGMGFGNITEMGKVKSLEKQGRAIATNAQPLPKPVEKWIMAEADKYTKKKWNKIKGRTFNI